MTGSPTTDGTWSYAQLRRCLALGRNTTRAEIDAPMARVGVAPVGGRWPKARVWAGLFGIRPVTDDDVEDLSEPLWTIARVARETGIPASTIRKKVAAGRLAFGTPVELGAPTRPGSRGCAAPRSRRWLPARVLRPLVGVVRGRSPARSEPRRRPAPAPTPESDPPSASGPAANGTVHNAFALALAG